MARDCCLPEASRGLEERHGKAGKVTHPLPLQTAEPGNAEAPRPLDMQAAVVTGGCGDF